MSIRSRAFAACTFAALLLQLVTSSPGAASPRFPLAHFAEGGKGSSGTAVATTAGPPPAGFPVAADAADAAAAAAAPNPLLPITYYHKLDSNGTHPAKGVVAALIFEAKGRAQIFIANGSDAIARRGSYSYSGGRLTLKFNDYDFVVNANFPLGIKKSTVTMPFKLFSPGPGSSTWARTVINPDENMFRIFMGASINEGVSTKAALNRVMQYGNGLAALSSGDARSDPARLLAPAAGPQIDGVGRMSNGVIIYYHDAPPLKVILFSLSNDPGKPLQINSLAGDPRVHLDPVAPNNGADDPPEKTALFISPHENQKTVQWYDYGFNNNLVKTPLPAWTTVDALGSWYHIEELKGQLEGSGYAVQTLYDDQAGVVNVLEALIPGKGTPTRAASPGMVFITSHGCSTGLSLGTLLGTSRDGMAYMQVAAAEVEKIKTAGYTDLIEYLNPGGTLAGLKTLGFMGLHTSDPRRTAYYIGINYVFWEYLRAMRGADFSDSLVYLNACSTDAEPYHRTAIQAKAFFGHSDTSNVTSNGAIMRYLVTSLVRHTHTAEEAYYNIMRTVNTRLKIYVEDNLLDMTSYKISDGSTNISRLLNGYGGTGADIRPYRTSGWMDTTAAANHLPGDIWWLLFAGRWGQDAAAGGQNMLDCWNNYYSHGSTGGLASPGCNAMAPGGAPTAEEIAYASYLLTGAPVLATGTYLQPRWTLNDGP